MAEPTQALSSEDFSALVEAKAASRRQDAGDLVIGRRTPTEVQRENAWLVSDPARTFIFNESAA